MNGFLVIDKPSGWTSHDVVGKIRRLARGSKVGHGGTLDPMATGVLPVALGKATRVLGYIQESDKAYRAVARLGVATDTHDITGRVVRESSAKHVSLEQVWSVVASFLGEISQVPPIFSAVKKNGVPLYKLARKGEDVEREPRLINIRRLEVTEVDLPLITFEVDCSKGTYIRTLCHDMGEALGVGGCLESLVRTQAGPFRLLGALGMDEVERLSAEGRLSDAVIPMDAGLTGLCRVQIGQNWMTPIRQGGLLSSLSVVDVQGTFEAGDRVALISREGSLLAVARALAACGEDRGGAGLFQPERVFI